MTFMGFCGGNEAILCLKPSLMTDTCVLYVRLAENTLK